jgi:hypothetical protein
MSHFVGDGFWWDNQAEKAPNISGDFLVVASPTGFEPVLPP